MLFLYVVNTEFLEHTSRAVREDVVTVEIKKLGEFLLEMARERAVAQGVAAGAVLRHGGLRAELKAAARELGVDVVVLGKPVEGGDYSIDEIQAYAAELEAELGVEALVL